MENDRISVKEAAAILGMSEQGIKEHMKNNLFDPPIGHVTQISKSRKQYHIYKEMLEQYKSGKAITAEPKTREEIIGEIVIKAAQQILQIVTGA